MPRNDAFGFFWNDVPIERKPGEKRPQAPRPLPEIPANGWKPPKSFPRLEKAKLIAIDTETKDLELLEKGPGVRRGAHIVGLSVATDDHRSWYFPMRHELGENLPVENVISWAKDNLTRTNQPKVGTNLLYDLDFLAEAGVNVTGPFYDVQVAEALLDENARGFSLEAISQRHLSIGKTTAELEDWIYRAYGTRDHWQGDIWRAPSNLVGPYAETDALNPILIYEKQLQRLKMENLLPLWEIESGLAKPLLAMRRRGVRVDLKHAAKIEGRLEKMIAEDAAKLKHAAGFDININAGADLVKLFDSLGLTYPRTAPSTRHINGQPSFVKEFLEHHPHPTPQLITRIRRWTKFRDTFIRGYIYDLHINGRIHCQFNQTVTDEFGAVSGRFSSSNPNLQNIPWRDEIWGPLIRAMFLAEVGEDWGRLDLSQIEYRILVHLAFIYYGRRFGVGDAIDRYTNDPATDYHQFVSDITRVPRKIAKNINFGFAFGMGAPLLASHLGLQLKEAEPIFNQYHAALPFVSETRKKAMTVASESGMMITLLGRRRRFDLWQPKYNDEKEQQLGLPLNAAMAKWGTRLKRAYTHKALNAYTQGGLADLIKKIMYEYSLRDDLNAILGPWLLTVHDEGDFSVPRTKQAREAMLEVKRMMENCIQLCIPTHADLKIVKHWGEAA